MKRHLVPKQITDRRGYQTTRWVLPAATPASNALKAAKPTLRRGAVKEMKALRDEIIGRLEVNEPPHNMRGRGEHRNWEDSFKFVSEAFIDRDHDMLKVYERFLPSHEFHTLFVRNVTRTVRGLGHEDTNEVMTDEFVEDAAGLSRTLLVATLGGLPEPLKGIKFDDLKVLNDRAVELMFLYPGSGKRVRHLIMERGTTNPDDLEGLLQATDEIPTSLYDGVL